MSDEKRKRFFLSNPASGEPWAYCGDMTDRAALERALGLYILNEIEADMGGTDADRFELAVKAVDMTDAEVEALPDM